MFSFGIEYERAFSTAFASARFAAGSGPPSRAATMIARESLEKSLPRLASAAPFLCLIELHLLCPDTHLLPDEVEEPLVDARVVGQLGMEGGDDDPTLAEEHRLAVQLGEHLDVRADLRYSRRTDEDSPQRLLLSEQLQIRLEARHLASIGVAAHGQVEQAEVVTVEQDHPGTGAEHRSLEAADRLLEPVQPDEPSDRGRFAPRNDQPVELGNLLRLAHLDGLRADPPQHRRVLAEVPLHRQDADSRAVSHPFDSSRGLFTADSRT